MFLEVFSLANHCRPIIVTRMLKARTLPGKSLPLWMLHSLMLLVTIVISGSFTVGAAITHGLEPSVLLLVRYGLATFCLAPLVIHHHGFTFPEWQQLLGYSLLSAITVGFFWCMFESLRYTSAFNTSVIYTLVPGISGIYSAIILKERLGKYRIMAVVYGMLGALWVIFRGDMQRFLALELNYGDLIFLVGCFLMAAYPPLVKKLHKKEPMVVMTFWVMATGMGWFLLLAFPKLATVDWAGVEASVWAGIIYLALLSTIFTFYLNNIATIHLGPTRVMAYSYFYPAFVLGINWGLGKGLPPAIVMPGVAVICLATVVLQRGVTEPVGTIHG